MAGEFTQFDGNGFLKVGTREIDKALGDAIVSAVKRVEQVKDGIDVVVNAAKEELLATVGAGISGPLVGGMVSIAELNEDTTTGIGLHAHQGLYYRLEAWPEPVFLGAPVTLGPPDGDAIIIATWDSPAYLGLAQWREPPLYSGLPSKGRVITAGALYMPSIFTDFTAGTMLYVGDGDLAPLTTEDLVPTGKWLVPVGMYLGQGTLKLVSAPAKLKT